MAGFSCEFNLFIICLQIKKEWKIINVLIEYSKVIILKCKKKYLQEMGWTSSEDKFMTTNFWFFCDQSNVKEIFIVSQFVKCAWQIWGIFIPSKTIFVAVHRGHFELFEGKLGRYLKGGGIRILECGWIVVRESTFWQEFSIFNLPNTFWLKMNMNSLASVASGRLRKFRPAPSVSAKTMLSWNITVKIVN